MTATLSKRCFSYNLSSKMTISHSRLAGTEIFQTTNMSEIFEISSLRPFLTARVQDLGFRKITLWGGKYVKFSKTVECPLFVLKCGITVFFFFDISQNMIIFARFKSSSEAQLNFLRELSTLGYVRHYDLDRTCN